MSKMLMPAAVGNEFIVGFGNKLQKKLQTKPVRNFNLPEPTTPVSEAVVTQSQLAPALVAQPVWSRPVFLNGQVAVRKSQLFTKTRVTSLIVALLLISFATGLIAEKQHVIALAYDAKNVTSRVIENLTAQKAATPKPVVNPRSITVSASQADNAFAVLVSQPISIKVGSNVITPSSNSIISWLNLRNAGSTSVISVNTQTIVSYIKQIIASDSTPLVNRVIVTRPYHLPVVEVNGQNGVSITYSQSVINTIANNVLKGNGVSVTLPTKVVPYQTTVSSS